MGNNNKFVAGALAGLAGGLAASWAMNQLMTAAALLARPVSAHDLDPQRSKQIITEHKRKFHQMADPTGELSDQVAQRLLGRHLTNRERELSGPIVHYAFGALAGAAYGVLASSSRALRYGDGIAFGLALWIAGDEFAVPALGLAPKPQEVPLDAHVAMFASHIVYGYTLETVRRLSLELAA